MAAQNIFAKVNGDALNASEANMLNVAYVEAGEAITAGNAVYIHLTSGTAFVSDLATQNDRRAVGIALNTVALGADVSIQTGGIYVTSGLTDKEDYYIGNTGALSTTVSPVRIGTALSTTELLIDIRQDDKDVVGTIKAWLKSHAGMPSNMLNAFWKECDGSLISDTESPLNNAGAGEAPLLNGTTDATRRFLRGSTTSDAGTDDTFGGSSTHSHSLTFGSSCGRNDVCNVNWVTSADAPLNTGTTTNVSPCASVVFIMKIK